MLAFITPRSLKLLCMMIIPNNFKLLDVMNANILKKLVYTMIFRVTQSHWKLRGSVKHIRVFIVG